MEGNELVRADDAALMLGLQERSDAAMAEVYRRHSAEVMGLARRILNDKTLAEDVTQETFLLLWRTADRLDPNRGRLRSILLTSAHGRAVELIRARNSREARERKVHDATPEDSADLDRELMALTEAEHVRRCVAALPAEERIPLEMAYFGGNTYREVAVILDLAEGTVKGRIRAALRDLHALVADTDSPPRRSRASREDRPWTAQ